MHVSAERGQELRAVCSEPRVHCLTLLRAWLGLDPQAGRSHGELRVLHTFGARLGESRPFERKEDKHVQSSNFAISFAIW